MTSPTDEMADESLGEFAALRLSVRGGVAELVLTRPEEGNPFDGTLHPEFQDAIGRLRSRRDIRAAVIGATGEMFSGSGGNLEFFQHVNRDLGLWLEIGDAARRLFLDILDLRMPVVAALNGPARGFGATVALACDAVVAARSASLAEPHVTMGLVAGDGGPVVWPHSVGVLRAKRYLLTGDPIPAEDAFRMGLVTDLVDQPAEALSAGRALAARIAALPPLAVQGTKRAVNRGLLARAGEVLELGLAYEGLAATSADMREVITAHREGRPGRFAGR
ncbi:enoyl-CoA hydratase/isomerase family protein [Pseudonocardia acaciae]|uniref:enoyl-CoA hydratase/isomerase family protein n=1 Tax=Pseudonocardia acaciae TaxID=551276 RepID=UPI00048B110C|nr:enoyl-CoA hydratase/isomerase family protein [Pseudonocardia acaciae]